MPRTIRRSSVAQSVCSDAHNPQHFRRAVCAQCRAQAAYKLCALPRTFRRSSVAQCVRNVAHKLCALSRTVRRSTVVQSVRNVAHNLLPNAAPQAVQSDADATYLHPRVIATATSRNAAAKRKTASGVRDQENSMESGTERLQLHSDTRVASCGG